MMSARRGNAAKLGRNSYPLFGEFVIFDDSLLRSSGENRLSYLMPSRNLFGVRPLVGTPCGLGPRTD